MADKYEREVTTIDSCPFIRQFPGPQDPLDDLGFTPHTCGIEGVSCLGLGHRFCILERYDEVIIRKHRNKTQEKT